jgi:signal transduction histidine kinase
VRTAWLTAFIALGAALTAVVLVRGGGLSVVHVLLTPLVGWSFGVAGMLALWHRRWRRVGVLLLAVGLAWFVHLLDWTHVPVLAATGAPVRNAYTAVFAHLLLAFPTGRVGSSWSRALVIAGYLNVVGVQTVAVVLGGPGRATSWLRGDRSPAAVWYDVENAVGVVLACLVMATLIGRARSSRGRPPGTVLAAAAVAFVALVANLLGAWFTPGSVLVSWVVFLAGFAAVPFAFLASLLGLRLRRAVVEAAATERRRIERNLHDGAQQRLVSVAFTLGLARSRLAGDPSAAGTALAEAQSGLSQALDELRRLSQGIHPGVLVERGLRAAITELAWAAPVPAHVTWQAPDRLPDTVELAGYYVVAEALTNAAKHARAAGVRIRVSEQAGRATITVSDDGIGGAHVRHGTGLQGLTDRAEILGGRLTVHSPAGAGTTIRMEVPCG